MSTASPAKVRPLSQPDSVVGSIRRSVMSQPSAEQRLELAKIWMSLGRHRSLDLYRLPSRLVSAADLDRILRLSQEMADIVDCDPPSAAKYPDYNYWIPYNVLRIARLALHRSPPLHILDVGCGPGYFMAASHACGHHCHGIDAPAEALTDVEARVYSEMLAALGCSDNVGTLLIERFQPMPLSPGRFDLITAYSVCFNRHQQPDEWGVEEWRFWAEDALSHLAPNGILHLELNPNPERYGKLQFYDRPTLDYFRSVGTVQHNNIRITRGKPGEC